MREYRNILFIFLVSFVLLSIGVETVYNIDMLAIEESKEVDGEKDTIEFESFEKDKKNVDQNLPYLVSDIFTNRQHTYFYKSLTDLNYHFESVIPPEITS